MRLAVFDLDGTVLRGNSWQEYFWWTLRSHPCRAPALLALLFLRQLRLIEARTLKNAALRTLRGASAAKVAALGERIFRERLNPTLRGIARTEVARARADGCELVLATGAFDFLARPVAAELGIAHVLCTRVEMHADVCAGRIDGTEVRGTIKAEALKSHFADRPVDWAGSRAFSDELEDLPLLSLVGTPTFVARSGVRPDGLPAHIPVVGWTQ
jgi:putative phosphoserine phosphatase/1-acylglycerol-3-phosphate O-acyltransferase